MPVRTKQQIRAEGVPFVEYRTFVGDAIVVGIFKNENAVGLWPFVIRVAFVSVVLLNEDTSIGCHSYSNGRHDVWVLSEQRNTGDVGVMNLGRERGLFSGRP